MEIEVDGVIYKSAIEKDGVCEGCVAEDSFPLCESIGDEYGCCIGKDGSNIIWIKKETK